MEKITQKKIGRRKLITSALLSTGAVLATTKSTLALNACGITPGQTSGPFYPVNEQADKDSDLTYVQNKNQRALGEVIIIRGVVSGKDCRPIKNAIVEIWQACASGRYNHPQDPNKAKLDKNFQYWGRATTNEKGEYKFITIKPGEYVAIENEWTRPPHIHFKIHLRGYEELTSQLYFSHEKHNAKDKVLLRTPANERSRLMVDLQGDGKSYPKVGEFNIVLNRY